MPRRSANGRMKFLILPFLNVAVRLFSFGTSTHAAPVLVRAPTTARQADIGPAHILYQNDLSQELALGAILLTQPVNAAQAVSACQSIGEELIAHDGGKLPEDVLAQLRFAASTGRIAQTDSFWVLEQDGAPQTFNFQDGSVAASPADQTHPVLCSHTAAPTVVSRSGFELPTPALYGEDKKLTVEAGDYILTGIRDRRSFRFLGIPYAAPPLGTKRFMHAEPYNGPKELDAFEYGAVCPQAEGTTDTGSAPNTTTQSEDCLNLNVYTSSLIGKSAATPLKPVVVYIHGGAFVMGRNSEAAIDGGNLASRGDIVVVTIAYRLGALGFLASGSDLPGNAGLSDQIMALKWVKDHIAAFGGDPEQVTIQGESAGAQSVSALLASSASKGLYRAAIMQSNPWLPWPTRSLYTNKFTPAVAKSVSCPESGPEMVKCLQSVDYNLLAQGAAYDEATSTIAQDAGIFMGTTKLLGAAEPFLPVADDLIDDQFFYLAGNGTLPNKVPTMVGTVSGEGTGFIYPAIPLEVPSLLLKPTLLTFFQPDQVNDVAESNVFSVDAADSDMVRRLLSDAFTFNHFTCPTQEIISAAVSSKALPAQTWLYEMQNGFPVRGGMVPQCDSETSGWNTCHANDVIITFGSLNVQNDTIEPAFLDYTRRVADSWISFIRTMDPNPTADYLTLRGRSYEYTLKEVQNAPWRPYDPNSISALAPLIQTTYSLSATGSSNTAAPGRNKCDFLNKINALPQRNIDNSM